MRQSVLLDALPVDFYALLGPIRPMPVQSGHVVHCSPPDPAILPFLSFPPIRRTRQPKPYLSLILLGSALGRMGEGCVRVTGLC